MARLELPVDRTLPGLELLGHSSQLAGTLSRPLTQWLGPDAHLVDTRVLDVRRLAPGKRCSVELELIVDRDSGASESRRLLGKVYREDRGAVVYETLQDLRRHGLGAGRFIVPQPLAYLPDFHLLLVTWAEGESLSSVVIGRADASLPIAAAAEWLLRLHECGARRGRRYSFAGHLRTLASWKELLIEAHPEAEPLLTDLLARFEARGQELSNLTPRPTHRDFTPEHLIVHGDQFTGLDFDEFCQYDPRFDVAHFIAHLRFLGLKHFGRLNHFDWLADRFLACYEAGGGDLFGECLNLYAAIAYFKLGRFVAVVDRPQEWRQMLPELLNEARRLL